VSEVIVYNRALTEVERQQVEQYLRTKWLGAPPAATDPGLGVLAFDPTWAQAPVRFGDQSGTAADALAADYGTAPARGADRIDTVLLGGQGNDTLTGGSRNDALFGGAGNDRLVGDAGTNYLAGGTGDDTYIVSSATDYVFEAAGAGTDIVESSVSFVLMPNIERLVLTGTASINGTGNDLDTVITGNSGNNTRGRRLDDRRRGRRHLRDRQRGRRRRRAGQRRQRHGAREQQLRPRAERRDRERRHHLGHRRHRQGQRRQQRNHGGAVRS
jgi:hypothetical protein